jgi:hypothetical protein
VPRQPTYPGVHVEEIPSGVRTITGVATSITTLGGRAVLGEKDEPVTINNFGDFERLFGGLNTAYLMNYVVHDFYPRPKPTRTGGHTTGQLMTTVRERS